MALLLNRGANPNPVNINNLSLLTAVNRQIKDSQDGSEYNEQCKKILELMLLKGAKEAQLFYQRRSDSCLLFIWGCQMASG